MAFRSTGQPRFVAPVSTFNEKTKCFLVAPSIIASMKSDREARSMACVPLMPSGLMLPHGNPGRNRRAEVALPNDTAVVSVQRIRIIGFCHGNDHWPVWTALNVKRLRIHISGDRPVKAQVAHQVRCVRHRLAAAGRCPQKARSSRVTSRAPD